jgi:hypothetical protein
MAKLEVQIGADSSDLNAEISAAEAKIKRLGDLKVKRVKLGLDTKEITADINTAKSQLKGLETSLRTTGKSFDAMKKPVANGGNTLMQFSRIAQDAPYGMIGIQNNLTATAEGFAHLSASSGGAGNALKAVASSIMGVGGILLAVSIVTSALTYMSQNGITVGDVFSKLTGTFDEFANTLKKTSEEAAKSANTEISSLKSLVTIAQDVTKSQKDRNLAVQELQSIYPEHLVNLKKEKILNGDISSVVDILTNSLYKRSQATALLSEMDKKAVEQLQKFDEYQRDLNKTAKDLNLNADEFRSLEVAVKTSKEAISEFLNERRRAGKSDVGVFGYADALGLNTQFKEVVKINSEMGKFQNRITSLKGESIEIDVKLNPPKGGVEKVIQEVETKVKGTKQTFGGGFIPGGIVNQNLGLQNTELMNQNIVPDIVPEITQKTKDIEDALLTFNENTKSIIKDSIAGTFMNLGQVIGDALANGGNILKAAGSALLGAVGGLLSAMGGELIKLGTAAVLAGTVTKLFGSTLGIGAGIAAIAGGTLLSAVGSAMSSKSNKAVSGYDGQGGGISTGANYSSPSTSNFGSSSNGNSTVVFEISGQSLIGVLSNTLDKNTRLGGSLSLSN